MSTQNGDAKARSSRWFIARDGQQRGPYTSEQLKSLASAGHLSAGDLLWKEGMPQWVLASRVKNLLPQKDLISRPNGAPAIPPPQAVLLPVNHTSADPMAPVAGAQVRSTGTQNGNAGGPLTETLPAIDSQKPFASSPLSQEELTQLRATERDRRLIRQAAIAYRVVFWLGVIGLVLQLVMVAAAGTSPFNARVVNLPILFCLYLIAGLLIALRFILAIYTWQSQLWAPVTGLVLDLLNCIGICTLVAIAASQSREPVPIGEVIGGLALILIIPAIFVILSARACLAIPRFLNRPQWCQRVLTSIDL